MERLRRRRFEYVQQGGEVFKWWAQPGRKHSREHLDQDRSAHVYSERDTLHSVSVKTALYSEAKLDAHV